MTAFEISDLMTRRASSGKLYLEFLRVPAMSMGLYTLPAGGVDPQSPHAEDEAYYVISGRGQIFVGGEDRPVQRGSLVFVAAGVDHHFHSITDELQILVFFAPAEKHSND